MLLKNKNLFKSTCENMFDVIQIIKRLEVKNLRLTFVYDLKMNKIQEKIIKELMWHSSKVYNMLNYEVKEGKEKINAKGSINVEESKIYKKYRKENWHSEYLHSHT